MINPRRVQTVSVYAVRRGLFSVVRRSAVHASNPETFESRNHTSMYSALDGSLSADDRVSATIKASIKNHSTELKVNARYACRIRSRRRRWNSYQLRALKTTISHRHLAYVTALHPIDSLHLRIDV
jgi:hypothetical protein